MQLATIIAGFTGINVLLTFFYQWYIVTKLGPGAETDSLFASMVVPQLILTVVTGSLIYVLVPILSTEHEDSFHQEIWNFFSAIGTLFLALMMILYLTSQYWVPLTVPGFLPYSKNLTITLTRIQLVGMLFTALSGVLSSAYNARQQFIWTSLSQVLSSALGLVFLVCLLPRIGVMAAAWAMVLKMFFQMALLFPVLGRVRKPRFGSATFKKAWTKIKPLLVGNIYSKTDQLVDRFLASMAPMGELSLLHLSQQIYGAGNQVLNSAIAGPMVPLLARKAHANEWTSFRSIYMKRLLMMTGITCATILLIVLFGHPGLKLIFGYGRFNGAEITTLWWLLIASFGILVGGAAGQILSTSFYAQGDTQTPTRIGVVGFTIGLVFKVVGFYTVGVIGIAMATSSYLMLNAFIMLRFLSNKPRTNTE